MSRHEHGSGTVSCPWATVSLSPTFFSRSWEVVSYDNKPFHKHSQHFIGYRRNALTDLCLIPSSPTPRLRDIILRLSYL